MLNVSRCMSTQHPDNVSTPFFAEREVLEGNSEIQEAFYVFSQLGCREQMWDNEGKDVDNQVVEKLLTNYTEFFSSTTLGKDVFLTYRVPNPSVEKNQGKILLEVLNSIPRANDSAKILSKDFSPIFEVILPMATNTLELRRISTYYQKFVVGQQSKNLIKADVTIKDWIGEFKPSKINVIPLFENKDAMLGAADIVEEYLKFNKTSEYQRVFLARSDPALNYGSVSAVLLEKISLQRLHKLEEKLSMPILPMLGAGSSPFRGNLKPTNIDNCPEEYPSVQTFTLQSAFKYDYSFRDVINAIDIMNSTRRRPPLEIDETLAMKLFNKIQKEYRKQLIEIADLINTVSRFIPSRRARKLHVGLFGYSRSSGGISLPRAIKFTASFYSLGIPPELIGLSTLSEKELDKLSELYVNLDNDLKDSVQFLNKKNLNHVPKKIKDGILRILEFVDHEPNNKYCKITSQILENLRKNRLVTMKEDIESAAWMRKFLG